MTEHELICKLIEIQSDKYYHPANKEEEKVINEIDRILKLHDKHKEAINIMEQHGDYRIVV